jgi:hypothetical protein
MKTPEELANCVIETRRKRQAIKSAASLKDLLPLLLGGAGAAAGGMTGYLTRRDDKKKRMRRALVGALAGGAGGAVAGLGLPALLALERRLRETPIDVPTEAEQSAIAEAKRLQEGGAPEVPEWWKTTKGVTRAGTGLAALYNLLGIPTKGPEGGIQLGRSPGAEAVKRLVRPLRVRKAVQAADPGMLAPRSLQPGAKAVPSAAGTLAERATLRPETVTSTGLGDVHDVLRAPAQDLAQARIQDILSRRLGPGRTKGLRGTYRSYGQAVDDIAKETGLPRSTVGRILSEGAEATPSALSRTAGAVGRVLPAALWALTLKPGKVTVPESLRLPEE